MAIACNCTFSLHGRLSLGTVACGMWVKMKRCMLPRACVPGVLLSVGEPMVSSLLPSTHRASSHYCIVTLLQRRPRTFCSRHNSSTRQLDWTGTMYANMNTVPRQTGRRCPSLGVREDEKLAPSESLFSDSLLHDDVRLLFHF